MKSLLSVFEDVDDPFDDDSMDLFDLETKTFVRETVPYNLYELEDVGDKQFRNFIEKRDSKRSVLLSDTISKNKLSLFNTIGFHSTSKKDEQLSTAKCFTFFKAIHSLSNA